MSHDPAAANAAPLSEERLIACVRRGLRLDSSVPVDIFDANALSNINYVYRVAIPGKSIYLKVVPERPKHFPVELPRERVFSEAEGLRRFRALALGEVIIPEVLFVDEQEMALAMEDVGQGREILFDVLPEQFDLLAEQAEALGRTLGSVHGGTRYASTPRPPREEEIIRGVIFEGLLAPGPRQLFPESWDSLNAEMQSHRECLIHADLWSKNLLVSPGARVAVVDFEGVCVGDPAFDLATLIAVALVAAIERPANIPQSMDFARSLWRAWVSACGSESWPDEVLPRTLRSTACFLAARVCGPFAYSLSQRSRERLGDLARSLVMDPVIDLDAFGDRVTRCLVAAPSKVVTAGGQSVDAA